jgi:hypothetical protein
MELRIRDEDVIEEPVVESDEDSGWHTIKVTVNDQPYVVKVSEARRQDVIYGLGRIAAALDAVRV